MSIALTPATPRLMALAVRLAERGHSVVLVEPDPHDATRARDLLARRGVPVVARMPSRLEALVCQGQGALAPAGAVTVQIGTGGQAGPGLALADLVAADLSLAEILAGSDPRGTEVLERAGITCLPVPSFVGRGLMAAVEDAAEALVMQGAAPDEVDQAAEAAGFARGPCAAMDLRGLDAVLARQRAGGGPRLPLIARMVAEGRLGRAGGVGWYRYPGGGGHVVDPLIEDMAIEEARFAGLPRGPLPQGAIAARLLAALAGAARQSPVPAPLLARIAAALGLPLKETA